MPLRSPTFSNIEEKFLLKSLQEGIRIDQREMLDYRNLRFSFGVDHGCCTIDMGNTKVMAQVCCVLDRPKESRPSEGRLNVHVELSTIAYPSFDPTKPGDLGISIQRMIERSLLYSRAIDLEELCIRVGEKVWTIQLYIHVLSHDGNIIDCSFVAAIAALKHFRRPDVSISGQEVIVHSIEEKNPVPLTLHHMPLCVSFAFYNDCNNMIVDPTHLEEKVMDGLLMLSLNKHKEMCCLQMSGRMEITKEQILRCTNIAAVKVKELTNVIIKSLDHDKSEKTKKKTSSFTEHNFNEKVIFKSKNRTENIQSVNEIAIQKLSITDTNDDNVCNNEEINNDDLIQRPDETNWVTKLGKTTISIGEGHTNTWLNSSKTENAMSEDNLDSGNDEEDVIVMEGTMLDT